MHETTGTRDVTYDLISVLYHSLQAAEICVQYEKDAREEGKPELAAFFKKVIADNRELADEAKDLLRGRLWQNAAPPSRMREKALDKANADSFPASDPSATY